MKPRAIFTATTGRSGTLWLANVWQCVEGVEAHHQPDFDFQRHALAELERGHQRPMQEAWKRKWDTIKECNDRGNVYVETGNAFIKALPTYGAMLGGLGCIALTRSPDDVAESLIARGMIPGRQTPTTQWLPNPYSPLWQSVIPLAADARDAQRCRWYCALVATLTEEFLGKVEMPQMPRFRANLIELQSERKIEEMVAAFGFEEDEVDWAGVEKLL